MKIETKIPLYNLVNMLLTGMIFIGANTFIFRDRLQEFGQMLDIGNTGLEVIIILSLLAVAYQVGYVLFRLGAVVVGPILKLARLDQRTGAYADFNEARKKSQFLETLSREYASARTQIATFVVLMIISLATLQWIIASISLLVVAVFVLTARTHSMKINDVIKRHIEKREKEEEKK